MEWKEVFTNKKKIPLIFVAGIIIIIGTMSGLTARYIHNQKRTDGISAKNFYFTSDMLSEQGKTYDLSPDTTSLTIQVRNYEDELRWAETDIEYKYEVTKGDSSKKSGSGTISRNNQSGTSNSITIDGLSEGTYQINVTSIKPFSKTLTGTFKIPKADEDIQTDVNDSDGSAYVLVNVSVQNYNGKIRISWPDGLIPDATQEAFASTETYSADKYISGHQDVTVEPYSSYVYRFFKEDTSKDYSKLNQIVVTKVEN